MSGRVQPTEGGKVKSTTLHAERHRLERAELLLIRIGQHIFREWRAKGRGDKDLEKAFECVWLLKRQIRDSQEIVKAKFRQRPKRGAIGHA